MVGTSLMRTQFIESLILGVIIGATVLIVRWLVPNRLLFEVASIVVAAVLLTLVQLILIRRQNNTPAEGSPAAPPLAIPEAQTPIHSPQFGWAQPGNAEQPEIGEPTPVFGASDLHPTAVQAAIGEDQNGVASDPFAQEAGETEKKVV
jgi:hypothetical protein